MMGLVGLSGVGVGVATAAGTAAGVVMAGAVGLPGGDCTPCVTTARPCNITNDPCEDADGLSSGSGTSGTARSGVSGSGSSFSSLILVRSSAVDARYPTVLTMCLLSSLKIVLTALLLVEGA